MNLKHLKEEFATSIKKPGEEGPTYSPIYLITTEKDKADFDKVKETYETGSELRFIAIDKTKDLYIFSSSLAHYTVLGKLGLTHKVSNPMITGMAIERGGVWKTYEDHGLERSLFGYKPQTEEFKYGEEVLNTNWSWLDKYIVTTPFINQMKVAGNAIERDSNTSKKE